MEYLEQISKYLLSISDYVFIVANRAPLVVFQPLVDTSRMEWMLASFQLFKFVIHFELIHADCTI